MKSISRLEIVLGVAVVLGVMGLAIFANPYIKDRMIDDLKLYRQAVKIENDPNLFGYAIQSNKGDVMAYGQVAADEGQSFPEIKGVFSVIAKIRERYNLHFRSVCTSTGKVTTCVMQPYYSWDFDGIEVRSSQNYSFLGMKLSYSQINIEDRRRLGLSNETMQTIFYENVSWDYLYNDKSYNYTGRIRYRYEIVPEKFNATLFIRAFNGRLTNPLNGQELLPTYIEKTPADVIFSKQHDLDGLDILYYALFLVVGAAAYFFVAYEWLDL